MQRRAGLSDQVFWLDSPKVGDTTCAKCDKPAPVGTYCKRDDYTDLRQSCDFLAGFYVPYVDGVIPPQKRDQRATGLKRDLHDVDLIDLGCAGEGVCLPDDDAVSPGCGQIMSIETECHVRLTSVVRQQIRIGDTRKRLLRVNAPDLDAQSHAGAGTGTLHQCDKTPVEARHGIKWRCWDLLLLDDLAGPVHDFHPVIARRPAEGVVREHSMGT